MQSCKKGNEVLLTPETGKPEAVVNKDSISFTINRTKYVFTDRRSFGSGNDAVNIKRSAVKIPGGKLAYQTDNAYWYGASDSTLYSAQFELNSKSLDQSFRLIFTKKFKDNELVWKAPLFYLQNHDALFKIGESGFATDLYKENTTEGVAIKLFDKELNGELISMIPGFSIVVRSDLKNDLQDNSHFVITKVEKDKQGQYLIEARFNLNLYDKDGKLFKLENGFVKLTAPTLYN